MFGKRGGIQPFNPSGFFHLCQAGARLWHRWRLMIAMEFPLIYPLIPKWVGPPDNLLNPKVCWADQRCETWLWDHCSHPQIIWDASPFIILMIPIILRNYNGADQMLHFNLQVRPDANQCHLAEGSCIRLLVKKISLPGYWQSKYYRAVSRLWIYGTDRDFHRVISVDQWTDMQLSYQAACSSQIMWWQWLTLGWLSLIFGFYKYHTWDPNWSAYGWCSWLVCRVLHTPSNGVGCVLHYSTDTADFSYAFSHSLILWNVAVLQTFWPNFSQRFCPMILGVFLSSLYISRLLLSEK